MIMCRFHKTDDDDYDDDDDDDDDDDNDDENAYTQDTTIKSGKE